MIAGWQAALSTFSRTHGSCRHGWIIKGPDLSLDWYGGHGENNGCDVRRGISGEYCDNGNQDNH